jgi:tyrosine-protein kinase Etk/Wzc
LNTQTPIIPSRQQPEEDFSIQNVVNKVIQYWWLFVLCIVLALGAAFVYLRYSTPLYKVQAKILVKDSKKGGGISGMEVFSELGLMGGQNSVDNEVELLKSRTLMENTVATLQANVRYYAAGKIKQTEVTGKSLPFLLSVHDLNVDSLSLPVRLLFKGVSLNQFKLAYKDVEKTHSYGDTIVFPFGKFLFSQYSGLRSDKEQLVQILISHPENTVAEFQQKLNVAVTSKTVSTIDLTFNDAVPARGELLLNSLLHIYNRMNTEDKNRVADSTINFIDNRLVYVTRELGDVEQSIEHFRQRNQLTDISAQGKLLLENTSQYFKELSKSEVQISIVQSLEKYLRDEQNTSRTIPAGLVIEDPTFASLVERYNMMQLEKDRQLQTTTESNPVVQRLTVQIANVKNDIVANLATIKRSMEITRAELKNRTNSFESQIQQVPRKERAFLEISRQQAIKQELYLYLLKKREETAVSKAANIDNARIVDSAKADRNPISPKRQMIYLSALLIGTVLPSIFLFARSLLNNKVGSKKDITAATSVPLLGEIGHSQLKNNLVIKQDLRHPIAEQFRLLRTNLDYMRLPTTGARIVMVTSSMSGEGKSFISLNLAAMLSLGGKKVVLLEFDLRKPKLSKYLGFENDEGISSILIGKVANAALIEKSIEGVDNLHFLSSGLIPPNPAELINGPQTAQMFEQLKARYDHIIIDAPPVGVVTDALLLSIYTDITLYVVRQHYTFKNQLEMVDELHREQKLPSLGIVVNDVKRQKGYGYGYGYGSYGQEK